jgi:transcriptional regulator with XRE-family HTH domain
VTETGRATDLTRYIADQVRALRRERGMTAEHLATVARVTRTHIAKLESGRRQRLSVDELVALAAALRVPVTRLLPPAGLELAATPAEVLESVIVVLDAVRQELK